jgi:polysaccharide export outer membrane protein
MVLECKRIDGIARRKPMNHPYYDGLHMENISLIHHACRNTPLALFALLLSGCSLAPGMYFDRHITEETTRTNEHDVKPVFKNITPQLIQEESKSKSSAVQSSMTEIIAQAEPYKIGVGDYLSITVWDHPELIAPLNGIGIISSSSPTTTAPPGYTVNAEGKVQFPYASDVKVVGLTEAQARSVIVEKLAKFIRQPEVTLRVISYRSKRVYLDGEIKTPGVVTIDDIPLTLPEALSRAGGISALGDQSRISITRTGKTYWVDLPNLGRNGIDPSSILLRNADLVRVSPRDESKVFVVGEVSKPIALPMVNGRLTLNSALGEAGGISSQTGDGSHIYVIRNAADDQPIIYHLDGHSPVMFALAEGFELKSKDVIFVDAAPLVRLNRVISLILPTAQTITIANRGFQ